MRNIVFINESSGNVASLGVAKCARIIREQLEDRNIRIELLRGEPSPIDAVVKETLDAGDDARIFAVGGDGTLTAIATALEGTDFRVAPLPGGTMNALARDIGYSGDLGTALNQIHSLENRLVDSATIEDKLFLNNVVLGVYADAAESRERVRKGAGFFEKFAALGEVAAAVTNASPGRYELDVDGTKYDVETNTLMIANNIYTSAEDGAPKRAQLNAGELGVYIAEATTPGEFVEVILAALANGLTAADQVKVHRAISCTVRSLDGDIRASVDGETMQFGSEVFLKIKPGGLRLLAPARAV